MDCNYVNLKHYNMLQVISKVIKKYVVVKKLFVGSIRNGIILSTIHMAKKAIFKKTIKKKKKKA